MPFLYVNENIAFKAFGTIGNQYVERIVNYGIPNNNYWDWQAGLVVSVYGFDLSAAYTGTNLSVAGLPRHPELRQPRHPRHLQDVLIPVRARSRSRSV